jgi:hypothetical protein
MYRHGFAFVAGRRSSRAIVGKIHRTDTLIKSAQNQNFLTVSATPQSTEQTKKLAAVGDLVLRMKRPGALDGEYRSFGSLVLHPTSGEGANISIDLADKERYSEDEDEEYFDEDYSDDDYAEEEDFGDTDDEDDTSDDIKTEQPSTPFKRYFKRLREGEVSPEHIQEVANAPWDESSDFEYELFNRLRFLRLIKTQKAGWKMAIILHYAAIGEDRPLLETSQGKSQKRKSRKILVAELEMRGISSEGLSKVLHARYTQALLEEQMAFNEELIRRVLADRGASDMGTRDELNLRLVKSVLNVPVENK